jgi:hypothetical protein
VRTGGSSTVPEFSSRAYRKEPKVKSRPIALVVAILLLVLPGFAKHKKMPLPQLVLNAKTIYVDNRTNIAQIGDRAYDELQKWGRYQVVDSPDKADLVLLLSIQEYTNTYTYVSPRVTTGSVSDNGNINTMTYGGDATTQTVVSGTTFITLIDPETGKRLWKNARHWGRGRLWMHKSATRELIRELRNRVKEQEASR